MTVASHRGPYTVEFSDDGFAALEAQVRPDRHILIDRRVADLYNARLTNVLAAPSTILLDATEETKSLERLADVVNRLVSDGMRRDRVLVAVGGGIIQDVTCFLAAVLLRGVEWWFWPTTLLAQADSCIGSKSSINCGAFKNILGSFVPPKRIAIDTRVLASLDERDLRSGMGEILKAHAISGPDAFGRVARDYDAALQNPDTLRGYIRAALDIKRSYVERDEFDQGERLVFNYGHSFGHAIEAATNFAVPHGIAVTIGCDMANHVAVRLGVADRGFFERMHPTLARNYRGFERTSVPMDRFLNAIGRDKKNLGEGRVTLILPNRDSHLVRDQYPNDQRFADACAEYLTDIRVR